MKTIDEMIADGSYEQAMTALDSAISSAMMPDAGADPAQAKYLADLYFRRGKLNWRLGQRKDALNDYAMAESLDAGSPASMALAQARAILDFHAPDLYNP